MTHVWEGLTTLGGLAALLFPACITAAAALDLDVSVEQGDGGGGDAGDAAGLAEGHGADAVEGLLHLAGEAADAAVVEPGGDGALPGLLHALDGAALLFEVGVVFDLGLDGLHLVAHPGGEALGSGEPAGVVERLDPLGEDLAGGGEAVAED